MRALNRCLLLVTFVLITGSGWLNAVRSQEATAQPQQGVIRQWSQSIIFPAAIRFNLTVELPQPEIQAVTLVVQPEGRETITIPVDLSEAILVGGAAPELEVIWFLPAAAPPILFREVTFSWTVVSSGNAVSNVSDRLVFRDDRTDWVQDIEAGTGIRLTLSNGQPKTGQSSLSRTGLELLQANVRQMQELLDEYVGQRQEFNVLVYAGGLAPECAPLDDGAFATTDPVTSLPVSCDPEVATAIVQASEYDVIETSSAAVEAIQNTVIAHVVRRTYDALWDGQNVPEWFAAGLVQFYAPVLKSEEGLALTQAARNRSLLPLEQMVVLPSGAVSVDLWQAQSYGMVAYIASVIGVDGLLGLASDIPASDSFEAAYQTAMGKSSETLVSDVSRWVFNETALGAFNFTLYQGVTATPTASRTPTSTFTPTATMTLTPTVTPSVTGVLSATPRPTNTATSTATAAPPTVTPRPAGSLNTATPVPVPPAAVPTSGLTIGILLLLGGLILIAIVIVFVRPSRR